MNKEDSFYMDTLEKTQPETFDFINHLSEQCHSELSFASHEINNQLSFIRSSYQLISKKHPETKDFPFWAELGDTVNIGWTPGKADADEINELKEKIAAGL